MRSKRSILLAITTSLVLVAGAVSLAIASPASNVAPQVLARATFDEFKVMSNPVDGQLFKAEAKGPIDVVVRQHTYLAGGFTGWHAHPYPVLITVKEGTLTFYDASDPTCTPQVLTAGQGYVDDGRGHMVVNEGDSTAIDVSVIMAPVGGAFRSELVAPNPYCGF